MQEIEALFGSKKLNNSRRLAFFGLRKPKEKKEAPSIWKSRCKE
jgi:hypothetical protein